MRIEVGIEYDDCVRRPEVDAYTACSCTEDVDKDVRVGLVERVHVLLSICLLRVTVLYK